MTRFSPSMREEVLLRALALPTADRRPDFAGWWSVADLRGDRRTCAMFGDWTPAQVTGIAASCVRKGLARSRHAGSHGPAPAMPFERDVQARDRQVLVQLAFGASVEHGCRVDSAPLAGRIQRTRLTLSSGALEPAAIGRENAGRVRAQAEVALHGAHLRHPDEALA